MYFIYEEGFNFGLFSYYYLFYNVCIGGLNDSGNELKNK